MDGPLWLITFVVYWKKKVVQYFVSSLLGNIVVNISIIFFAVCVYPFIIYECRSWSDCENRKWTNWIFNEFKWRNWCWWPKQQYYIIYRSFDWTSLFSPSCYEKKQKREKTSSICKEEGSFIIKNFDLYCLHDGMLSQVCRNSKIIYHHT